jgi:Uma2 family endonuclease
VTSARIADRGYSVTTHGSRYHWLRHARHLWEPLIMATTTTTISEQEFRELVLSDEDRFWELWDGVPVEKPAMSFLHNGVSFYLGATVANQLDWREYRVTVQGDRARVAPRSFFIPDVMVIPAAYQEPLEPLDLGLYADPLPFVAEIWSPSTGRYDIAAKLPRYRERGDLEIWYVHPYERTVTVWRRQADGSDTEDVYTEGIVAILSLPGVVIDLDTQLHW